MAHPYRFYNLSEQNMTFEDVFSRIYSFIKEDPKAEYRLSIGTDSQVHKKETRFKTAIHLHRIGRGAWGCLKDYTVPRKIKSISEKISLETTLSQEIAYLFTDEHINKLSHLLWPHIGEGADFYFEIHLDIGKKGLTRELIQEMVNRISAMGMNAKIKPDSYAASSYANRYTK